MQCGSRVSVIARNRTTRAARLPVPTIPPGKNSYDLIGSRLLAVDLSQTVAMQVGSMDIEPSLGAFMVRAQLLHQTPEAWRVIHFDEVRNFVRRKVI